MTKTRAHIALAVLLALAAGASAADKPLRRFAFAEGRMGTKFKILVYAGDEASAKAAAKGAFARVAQLDGIMSDYRDTSELMRLCEKAGGPPVKVSPDLFAVLQRAEVVSRRSNGAFDVTVGPVVRLWRRVRYTKRMPAAEELAKARSLVGYQNVRLNADVRTVQLLKPGMRLDLGGIAKGYAADAALAVLKQHGIQRALVAAGGDIAVTDPPPGTEGWNVGIAPLLDPDSRPKRFLTLKNGAVSTSGDAEQFIEIGGKRYSHIVDPRTGVGLVGRISVTVVALDGATADSLTKVVAVLGPERGLPIIDAIPSTAALVVRKTDKGEETFASQRWKKLKIHHKGTKGTKETQREE
jgi:thiamine biosynthesis lipoprotein